MNSNSKRGTSASHGGVSNRWPDAATIKEAAAGRWLEILAAAGIPAELLDVKGHPCPRCGGTDRFAAFKDVAQRGAVHCRQCFAQGGGDGLATVAWIRGIDFPEAVRWIAEYLQILPACRVKAPGERRIVREYNYLDETGNLLFQVVRFHPKDFRQRRRDPSRRGGWSWALDGVRRVLYRLPELLAADPARTVFVCEGEKDADRLAALGMIATTVPGGAGKWQESYSETLRARPVVIVPDNDKPGREHAQTIAAALALSVASVKILKLPDLPEKGDVSDWLDGGATVEQLEELANAAPPWSPDDSGPDNRPGIVRLCDVAPSAVQWLWPGRIPMGKLSLICGDPGTGKSTLIADLAARVSAGLVWPDAPSHRVAGDVWLISLEDDLADTIRPRLDAAGADVSRVHALPEVFSLDRDLARLELALSGTPGARLLVIDPIAACLGRVDSHKNADVRGALAPLALLASRRALAVVCVHHLNKAATGPALYRAAGSLAFTAAARAVWLVVVDRNDKRRRLWLPIKSNLSEALTGLAYHIEGDEARNAARIVWEPKPIELSADEALTALMPEENDRRRAREDAKEWLRETLADGEIWTKDLQTLAKENGHAWATVRRALAEIDAKNKRRGNGRNAKWYWRLPMADDDRPLFASLAGEALNETAPELVALQKPR